MRLIDVVQVSHAVAQASGRLDKIQQLAALIARTPPGEVALVTSYLSGVLPQGRTGIGMAALRAARDVAPAAEATLTVAAVDAVFAQLQVVQGAGATASRVRLLRELLARAITAEQEFLVRLIVGELRQGALESVLAEAVARAFSLPPAAVRRAVMMAGGLAPVAQALANEGARALARFDLQVMQPVQPMLADSAPGVTEALESTDAGSGSAAIAPAILEYKLDGARIQVHKVDDDVRIFSRALNDVTSALPEVVHAVREVPARSLVLDGEALALRDNGSPHPFQVTMRRFGRRLDVDQLRRDLPMTPFFFDCLHVDGTSLVDEPLSRRLAVLDDVAGRFAVPRHTVTSVTGAEAFAVDALARGHEGVMVKALDAIYAAGRRGSAWIKVKPARTLDLVILAAEWGSGRRKGWLSNLHLGARDGERGGFVMLGKTFKGLTDEMLAWQTARLLALELGREGHVVHVRPELVAEIAFNDIQESPVYPGRLALRFARVKRYREDKTADAADLFTAVQRLYQDMTGLEPPPR